jgi:hypothetical protein
MQCFQCLLHLVQIISAACLMFQTYEMILMKIGSVLVEWLALLLHMQHVPCSDL